MSEAIGTLQKLGDFYVTLHRGNLPTVDIGLATTGIPICPRRSQPKPIKPTREEMLNTKVIKCKPLVPKTVDGKVPKVPRLAEDPQWLKDLHHPRPKKHVHKQNEFKIIPKLMPMKQGMVPYLKE